MMSKSLLGGALLALAIPMLRIFDGVVTENGGSPGVAARAGTVGRMAGIRAGNQWGLGQNW